MAENSKIQWTHHTFNPWRGCARVSPGCVHCYAETLSKRNPKTLGTWGVDGTRVVASPAYWQQPVKWDTAASRAGERHRVFCASLADVGEDRPDLVEPRKRLSDLIFRTPNLDWLLLTKRPENMTWLFPADILRLCWVGATTEDRKRFEERVAHLREIPAAVRFISAEPLLEDLGPVDLAGIDWVIVGGESGFGARPFDIAWARSIIRQCAVSDTECFVKQFGARPVVTGSERENYPICDEAMTGFRRVLLRDSKGGDVDEWPEDLRIRQFPVVGHVESLTKAKLELDR